MYGPCKFDDAFWTTELPALLERLPSRLDDSFMNRVYHEHSVPIIGGASLEGQAPGPPDFTDARQAFAMTRIARGQVLQAILPGQEYDLADPLRNISTSFPPTFIVHGAADTMVPIHLSHALFEKLKEYDIPCGMVEVPNEQHTFAAKMVVGSETWRLQQQGFDFLQSLLIQTK